MKIRFTIFVLLTLVLTVGCTNPREEPRQLIPPREKPIIPPWHPDHDINKQPHEWKTNADSTVGDNN